VFYVDLDPKLRLEGAMAEPRRLAAILAADVVGYSRLMGEDEAGTARAVREHRDAAMAIVAPHGGRLVKTMGDGVLLEFVSIVAAVECAIAMQKQMVERNIGAPDDKRILYRIGVNLGDVLIDGDDILGDGVNIAARLESFADPGGVCISGSAYDQVIGKIEADFDDLGDKLLKNIARPTRVFAWRRQPTDAPLAWRVATMETPGPPRLSIVVLPFVNLGGEAEQDYFVDGVTESLTTDLSRIVGSFIIGRNTAFTYKGRAVGLKQIGRELNVRYVLEGSVQRGGNRMRVNVQLIDAEGGAHLWAERFEKEVADLFDMQDEIVARLANTLNTELVSVEARRAERKTNPDAMDLYFQAVSYFNKGPTPANLAQCRNFASRALLLDPDNIMALTFLAASDLTVALVYQSDDKLGPISSAEAGLSKVLSLAPELALAHYLMGMILSITHRVREGVSELERALALDRNLASAHSWTGFIKLLIGRGEETEAHVLHAFRLSPRDTYAYSWFTQSACAKLHLGADEEAAVLLRRSIELNRNFALAQIYLATALALLGRLDEAATAVRVVLALDPRFSIRRFRDGAYSDNPVFLKQRERIMEGMRMAGIPEG
jgi:TolB-like protein/class 3 adenylate cyclase/tetratricopeptide (TPR) repeat protein